MLKRMQWMAMVALLVVGAMPGVAQQLRYRSLMRFHVKPGHMADFLAAVKADKDAMTKAGYKRAQTWWRSRTGDGNEVVLVRYCASYAEMEATEKPDAQVSLARARVTQLASSTETVLNEVIPEATILGDRAKLPPYIRGMRATVKPDQLANFAKLIREEVGPVVKKAGLPLYVATQVRFGETVNQFMTVVGIERMKGFDETLPVEKAMGKAAYDALMVEYGAMVTHTEVQIYSSLPELNYLPQP
ncbi:MAG: hypothetical protein FJW36_05535 [Acidobacteria bacterium]|nr:hypothetical protein [Acidobacteriota bacterium]